MAMAFVWWVFREAGFGLCKAASCATLVTLYKGFCPQPGYPDPA